MGRGTPTLQVQTRSSRYTKILENAWWEFEQESDVSGLPLAEMLALWIRGMWTDGEFLALDETARNASGPIRYRLMTLAPRRLADPLDSTPAGENQVILGVELDPFGRPVAYHIAEEKIRVNTVIQTGRTIRIDASQVLHGYEKREADQVRGFPWLTSALPTIADMRAYDAAVLKAAHNAAKFGNVLQTNNPAVDPVAIPAGSAMELKEDSLTAVPPGWNLGQMRPYQPMAEYPQYRAERHRDIGRAVSMPLMMIRLDSREHNYSSARFDDQIYNSSLKRFEGWLERTALNRMVWKVEREAQLSMSLPRRPDDLVLNWMWHDRPHVDHVKEAMGERIEIENGTLPISWACASKNRDFDQVIAARKSDAEKLKEAGLPIAPAKSPDLLALTGMDDEDETGNVKHPQTGEKEKC
jgi:capsid protein